jgi:hypothetical protein
MDDVFSKLKRKKYVGDMMWCKEEREFVVNVYLGNIQYIRDNYEYIK